MLNLDQVQRQEEQSPAERAVEQECQQVRSRKRSRAEKSERQHWIRNSRLDYQKEGEEECRGNKGHNDRSIAETEP